MDFSRNYCGDGWSDEGYIEYPETDGFVDSERILETLPGEFDKPKIDHEDYDFSQHPQVIALRISKALEEKFDTFIGEQESLFGEIPLNRFPAPKQKVVKGEILYEMAANGLPYLFVNIFNHILCLGSISHSVNQGKLKNKAELMHKYILKSNILGDISGIGNTKESAAHNMLKKVHSILSHISPQDFPNKTEQKKEDKENSKKEPSIGEKEVLISGKIGKIEYTTYVHEGPEDIHLEFTYNGSTYHSIRLIEYKKDPDKEDRVYYIAPEDADKTMLISLIRTIGGKGKNPKTAVKDLIKNIVRVLKKNVPKDQKIIDFLESLKV